MPSATVVKGSVGMVGKRRSLRLRHVFLGLAFIAAAIGIVVSAIDPAAAEVVAPVAVLIGLAVAGGVIVSATSIYEGRERLAWRMIGTGMIIASAGVLVVALINSIAPAPTYGPPDLIFIFAYATVMAGFAIMPQVGAVLGTRVRVLLDGLIGALSMATLIWVIFYPALEESLRSATAWEQFAGVAFPLLDTSMVVVAMIVTIRRSNSRFDPRIVLFGVGVVAHAFADLSLLASGIGENFTDAAPNFTLFLVAIVIYLMVAAIIRRQPKPREYADRRQSLWAMLAPYGVTLVAIGLIAKRFGESGIPTGIQVLLWIGLVLVGLVVARQAVALREYRRLVQLQRSALVSSVSHELRTPLTALVGFLDVLKDPRVFLDSKERTELTDVVHQQAVYMSRIVADLLLLARSSSGLQLHENEVHLDQLIVDTLNSIPESQGVLDVEIDTGLTAYLDTDRLQQVIANLVVNAIRYGGGQVLVTASSVGDDLVIEVHDNGDGVPRKYELAIWDQFERGIHRLNSTVPGSGIGLAIVDMVVRRHGGLGTYERSKRLGGACFRITLPGRARAALQSEMELSAIGRSAPDRAAG
ncbi:MAG TPA: HAMP domain-containing sensor histidine kinase [Acidimicrobiia bacterium]|nr:HAMP domain-containing sensor histidine kinase [Acidimicrobiia bacterium]